ncbi:MAG: type II/IV secretion system protein [Gemmatimonadaceae bacterium]|nr:type II/IV secretion system protein [Gemmatimonadaceae bacterium]
MSDPAGTNPAGMVRDARRDGQVLRDAATSDLARRFPIRWLSEHAVLPLRSEPDGVVVAAENVPSPAVQESLSHHLGMSVRFEQHAASDIRAAILAAPRDRVDAPIAVDETWRSDQTESLDDLRAQASREPVVQLVNAILSEAMRAGASDVHIESMADGVRVRHRLDGVLHDVQTLGREFRASVLSRIKVMASLDIAERRVPQDGRARVRLGALDVDVRVSTLPALHGESVVLRLLEGGQQTATQTLEALGLATPLLARWRSLIQRPDGLLLATGPTGSGKSTTLHASLRERSTSDVKVVTVEDPVECRLESAVQLPVNVRAGFGFATALRAILRHDPDVILVGEMRDTETAEIAVRAALTGHLVFSTLHTTDAVSAVQRLLDMDVPPFLLGATLQGVVAQRLVRRVCIHCIEDRTPTATEQAQYRAVQSTFPSGFPESLSRVAIGTGCSICSGTGYRGRVAIAELLTMDDRLRALVLAGESAPALRAAVRETWKTSGAHDLAADGWRAVLDGSTTPSEVSRVISHETIG